MSALDDIRKIPYQKLTKLDSAVMAYGDWQAASDEDLAEAEEAAAELLKLRDELYETKKALYMAQVCNTMTLGAGNGAWTFGSTLYNRIEKVLSGFRPNAD